MEIITEHWSHGANAWMYYYKFESKKSFKQHLKSHGYDAKYFRIKHRGK